MDTTVEVEGIPGPAGTVAGQTARQPRLRSNPKRLLSLLQSNWAVLVLGLFFIGSLTAVLSWILYSNLPWFQAVMLLAGVSFFPLTHLAYQLRSEKHKARLVDDFELLGIVEKGQERQKVEEQYQKIHSPQQYIIFVSLVSLVTLLGFGLLHFNPSLLAGYMDPNPEMVAMTMFYSFLGAFVFSIFNVFRRFVTFDLQPGVYLYVVVMMLTVMIIGFVLARFLDNSIKVRVMIPVLAFTIGYFPDVGIRWIVSLASRVIGKFSYKETSLGSINGISIWHETRLREGGIDNTQNLEACDVRELLLSSRFSAQQLMNWIDQAILVTNLTSPVLRELNKHGINNITTFRSMVDSKGYDALPDLPPTALFEGASGRKKKRGRTAEGEAEAEQDPGEGEVDQAWIEKSYRKNLRTLYQAVYCAAETSPNYYYVYEYWKAVKVFRTRQVTVSTDRALGDRGIQMVQAILFEPDLIEKMGRAWTELGLPADILPTLFPDTPEGKVALSNLYIQLEYFPEAIRTLTESISEDPTYALAYASRGLAHARMRRFDESFADFNTAKELSPNYAVTYHHKGAALMMRGQYREAIAELTMAVKKDSSSAVAFFNRGRARAYLNEFDGALEDLTQAINVKPYAETYLERGVIYFGKAMLMQALDDFTQVIRLDNNNALAYARRGLTYMVLKDYNSARYDLNTAILYDPDLAAAYAYRGLLNFQLEDEESAIEEYTLALQLDPNLAEALRNRAFAYQKIGDIDKAIEDFRSYLKLDEDGSDAVEVRQRLAQLERERGYRTK